MPERTPEQREADRLERERRRAGKEGTPPPPEPAPEWTSGRAESDEVSIPEPALAPEPQPTQQFDVSAEWTEEHPVVATTEREVPLGTRRVGAHERVRAPRPAAPPAMKPPRPRRRLGRRAAAIVLLTLIVAIGWFLNALYQPFAGDGSGRVAVKIAHGATVGEIGDVLEERGVVDSSFYFRLRAKLSGKGDDIKSGAFTLKRGMSYMAALDALAKNPAPPPVLRVTIPEGRSRAEAAPLIRQDGVTGNYVRASRAIKGFDPHRYGAPKGASLEGFLFPATYELKRGATARQLVAQQLIAFKQNLAGIDLRYARRKNLTTYDVLVIASMVEREVAVAKERPLVAAVIYNRLHAGMFLGIDATLRFGLHNWTHPLKVSELQSDNPYNTRNHMGLPPGPIGSPGLASLKAAAHPAKVGYLYYVVKPGTCGQHAFSSTDAQFERDVARYNDARNAAGGKSPTKC